MNAELEARLRFETLIADLSSKFVNLPAGEVDREIEGALRCVAELLGIDLAVLWQWSGEPSDLITSTHFYCVKRGLPPPEPVRQEHYPYCVQQMRAGHLVCFSSPEELPAEAASDAEHFRLLGIKSSLCLPLSVGGNEPVGALALSTLQAERGWPDVLVKRLRLLAQILASALARKRADQALRRSEKRFRLLVEQAPEAVVALDLDQDRLVEVKRSEAALRASEARLAAGTDLAGLGYYEVDSGNRHCFMDERFREICGIPPALQLGLKPVEFWQDHVHPQDREFLLEQHQKLRDGRIDRISDEYRYQHPAQGQKWVHHLARIAGRSVSGVGVRTFGVIRDITEMKRLEECLRAAAEQWQTTFDSITDLVMILDLQQRIVRANSATVRFFALPMERIVGSLCFTLLHGTTCPIDGCPCQKTFQTRASSQLEVFHQGSGKWLLLSTDPITDAAGIVIGAVHVARDITEAKRAERETHELRDNLAHLTRVNTLGALSSSLAHELNQPLGIILSNAQAAQELLVQDPPDVAEVQAILRDIVAADRRAGEVIERLRSMLKRGQVPLQPLQLNQVIDEVLQLSRADLIGRGITVESELAADLPLVVGDRVQLQQLVLNLILNGVEAMASMAPHVRRLHIRTHLSQGRARGSVRDEGCGLPADAERLFQPFYTTKPKGLGLGLAICRSILVAHHGRLWAEPHPERGAIFYFELPVAGSVEST